jgi:ribosome-binding factor A
MPVSEQRGYRFAKTLQQALATIIQQDMRDPRLAKVTITGVDVTSDLCIARIHIVVRDADKEAEALKVLQQAAGFLKRRVGKAMYLKAVPELKFYLDESLERGNRINTLLSDDKTKD